MTYSVDDSEAVVVNDVVDVMPHPRTGIGADSDPNALALPLLFRDDWNHILRTFYDEFFHLREAEYIPANGMVHTYVQNQGDFSIRKNATISVITMSRVLPADDERAVRDAVRKIAEINLWCSFYGNSSDNRAVFDGILAMSNGRAPRSENNQEISDSIREYSLGQVKYAYLGKPHPQIIELPIGWNNCLTKSFLIFLMNGLVIENLKPQ